MKTMIQKFVESLDAQEFLHLKEAIENQASYFELSDDEQAFVQGNNPVAAIKAYRQRTGTSLVNSKVVVDNYRMSVGMTTARSQLNITEKDYVRNGNTVAAIKSYRSRTECSLKMAKEAIDDFRNRNPI